MLKTYIPGFFHEGNTVRNPFTVPITLSEMPHSAGHALVGKKNET